MFEQECIPVECVPPALYCTGGLCPGGGLCPRVASVQGGLCPSPLDRQTPVKILPCPKLRLQVVTSSGFRCSRDSVSQERNKSWRRPCSFFYVCSLPLSSTPWTRHCRDLPEKLQRMHQVQRNSVWQVTVNPFKLLPTTPQEYSATEMMNCVIHFAMFTKKLIFDSLNLYKAATCLCYSICDIPNYNL